MALKDSFGNDIVKGSIILYPSSDGKTTYFGIVTDELDWTEFPDTVIFDLSRLNIKAKVCNSNNNIWQNTRVKAYKIVVVDKLEDKILEKFLKEDLGIKKSFV